jgi:hypothetical protein
MFKRVGVLLCCLCCTAPGLFAQDSSGTAGAGRDSAITNSVAGLDSAMTDSAVNAVTDSIAMTDSVTARDNMSTAAADAWYRLRKDGPDTGSASFPVFRKLSPSTVTNLRKDDDFWYVPVGPDKKKPVEAPPSKPFEIKKWTVFLVYSVIAGLLVAAIVFLLQSGSGERWFRSSKRKTSTPEKTAADLAPPDLQQALGIAVDREDYSAAVRYLFLITLGRLAARNVVLSGLDKTNREYLRELRENALYSDFARLVVHYEYTFYGGFRLEQAAFRRIREQYEQFQNRLDAL